MLEPISKIFCRMPLAVAMENLTPDFSKVLIPPEVGVGYVLAGACMPLVTCSLAEGRAAYILAVEVGYLPAAGKAAEKRETVAPGVIVPVACQEHLLSSRHLALARWLLPPTPPGTGSHLPKSEEHSIV